MERTMEIKEKIIEVNDYVTKSNLPASDYVINPYIGCPHGCKYCYACFMKRFTKHNEEWGTFIDIKKCDKPINTKKLEHKSVFLSSVTDCYNKFEDKYCITQKIIKQLVDVDCELAISTKSSLILRDIDLLKQCKNLKVSMSINTMDEEFRADMDHASSIVDRLNTLKTLHENGIHVVLFMSPMFPLITDYKTIIECSKSYIDEYWFENLNLRGSYKKRILQYIQEKYPQYLDTYLDIYKNGRTEYWEELAEEIEKYCEENQIVHTNYFYHSKLVKEKLIREKKIDIPKGKEQTQKEKESGYDDLLHNIHRLHTTILGAERIQKNLSLSSVDVVAWCAALIERPETDIIRRGKNWYAKNGDCIITINAYNYGIITAHRK